MPSPRQQKVEKLKLTVSKEVAESTTGNGVKTDGPNSRDTNPPPSPSSSASSGPVISHAFVKINNSTDSNEEHPTIVCTCKRSKCIKLYCVCFASSQMCSKDLCMCVDCQNIPEHNTVRQKARASILEKKPNAFQSNGSNLKENVGDRSKNGKRQPQRLRHRLFANSSMNDSDGSKKEDNDSIDLPVSSLRKHKKTGCKCKRSFCLKKYCDCYGAGVKCQPNVCRCYNCKNLPDGATPDLTCSEQLLTNSNYLQMQSSIRGTQTTTASVPLPNCSSSDTRKKRSPIDDCGYMLHIYTPPSSEAQDSNVVKKITATNIYRKLDNKWYVMHPHAMQHDDFRSRKRKADGTPVTLEADANTKQVFMGSFSSLISGNFEEILTDTIVRGIDSGKKGYDVSGNFVTNNAKDDSTSQSSSGVKAETNDAASYYGTLINQKDVRTTTHDCIDTMRKLTEKGSITSQQKTQLLTDIITCAAKKEVSAVVIAYDLLLNGSDCVEEFAEQCRVLASSSNDALISEDKNEQRNESSQVTVGLKNTEKISRNSIDSLKKSMSSSKKGEDKNDNLMNGTKK